MTTKIPIELSSTPGIVDNSDATAITIDSSERVGIGTTSPGTKLHIRTSESTSNHNSGGGFHLVGNSTAGSRLVNIFLDPDGGNFSTSSDGAYAYLEKVGGGGDFKLINQDTSNMIFQTSGTERMRIDSSGTVLIGMTSDNYLAADDGIQLKAAGNIRIGGSGTSARNIMSFVNNTGGTPAEVGYIQTSGSGTAYGTSSDYRLKENVVDMNNAINRVKELKPKRFNFIVDADKTVDGFLAHEVSDIVPEAIRGTKDAIDDDGNPIYQGIDQSKLVPLLTKAIQELSAKVEELEGKIQ